ncbi:MAG: hypothetical protein ISR96_05135 [Nitrospira sp.]|nr:hypothetical protein [bacterium]MBL7048885.1 hypothetical protein [Nitrospira sp.]
MASYKDDTGIIDEYDFDFEGILRDHGFEVTPVSDECDGFCPDCGQSVNCAEYFEVMNAWDSIYI